MGKQDDFAAPTRPLTESSSSISLHSQEPPSANRYFDDDPTEILNDDLPPLYTDRDEYSAPLLNPLLPRGASGPKLQPFAKNEATGVEYYIDSRLDTDADYLAEHISALALLPPRPSVRICGTHAATHTTNSGNGNRTENKTVVDFDLVLDLTHLLYEDITNAKSWREVVPASNFEKVRRGTVFTTRAPGFGGSGDVPEAGTPDVKEWCRRFCSSNMGLRTFLLERSVIGWDTDILKPKIESLIRSTNYRGTLKVTFPVRNDKAEIWNDCRTNRWRLTKWIEMIFMFSFLFLFVWPYLFFRTKKFEVIEAKWHMSVVDEQGRRKYANMSEERWYNIWARPIQKAALEKRQGVVDHGDLERGDGESGEIRTGLPGAMQAGVEAMGIVNRSFGWGGNDMRC